MTDSSGRSTGEINRALELYGNMMFRIAYVMLGNECDAQDAVQDSFIKYLKRMDSFDCEEHEKAWLITVVTNICRDILRHRKRHQTADLDSIQNYVCDDTSTGILEALILLPESFRIVLTLYYIEDRSVAEIAKMIGRTPSAVKMRLKKGRELLEKIYRKEFI